MTDQQQGSSLEDYFIDDPQDQLPEVPGDDSRQPLRLRRLIPNFLTLCGLAAGMLAIQKAVLGEWDQAVLLVVFAGVIDTMDGALARLLKATSKFGAELDSLADFLSFGIAPGLMIYLWALSDSGPLGWIATLVFAMATALRLARFNSMADVDPRPVWAHKFFMGIPAPGGAGLAMMPIIFQQAVPESSELNFLTPLVGVWLIIIAGLMVSRLPMLSSKQIKLPKSPLVPFLALAGLLLAALIHATWITLSAISILYVLSIPLGLHVYRRTRLKNEAPITAPASIDTF